MVHPVSVPEMNYNYNTAAAYQPAVQEPVSVPDDDFGDIVRASNAPNERPDYSVNDHLATISGFTNYNAKEMRVIASWVNKLTAVFRKYGFTGLVLRPVEFTENLVKKGGLTKQIYGLSRVQDGSLTKYALPFDQTVPLAIFLAQHSNETTFPYMRYVVGHVFRGEHASKGRYRAFIQADNDYVDRELTPVADATTLVTTVRALQAMDARDFNVLVNHIVIAKAIIADAGVPENNFEDALRAIDKLKPDNRVEVVQELLANVPELSQEQAEDLLDRMSYRGPLADFRFEKDLGPKAEAALRDLVEMESIATRMGLEKNTVIFALNLTRGLDYYTGVVYETFIRGKERYGSIASGGRYDKLVDGYSNKETGLQGVGISIGVTRFFDIAKELQLIDLSRQTEAQVFVGYRIKEEGCFEKAIDVATSLREAGINVELYASNRVKVKKQLDMVNSKGIPFAVLVMDKEEIIVKNMKASTQVSFKTGKEVTEFLQASERNGDFDAFTLTAEVTERKQEND